VFLRLRVGIKPEDAEKVREARQAGVDSIEQGVPVQYGNEEDGIVIGYQRNGEDWICLHPLRDGGQKPFVARLPASSIHRSLVSRLPRRCFPAGDVGSALEDSAEIKTRPGSMVLPPTSRNET
jgi:hypothetical protein